MFYEEYDIERMVEDLKVLLRIPLWKVEIEYLTQLEMEQESGAKARGYCQRLRSTMHAWISLNKEDKDNLTDYGWMHTLLHELLHVVSDDFIFQVEAGIDIITDEGMRCRLMDTNKVMYERLVDSLASSFFYSIVDDNFIATYRRDKKHDVKAKKSS